MNPDSPFKVSKKPDLYKQADHSLNLVIFKKEYDLEAQYKETELCDSPNRLDSNLMSIDLQDYENVSKPYENKKDTE